MTIQEKTIEQLERVSRHLATIGEKEDYTETAIQALEQTKWIPCSERLPEKSGFYLCTTKDCITILEFTDGNYHYHEEPSFVSDVLGRCNSYVVAWMPLPERYEYEGDNNDK